MVKVYNYASQILIYMKVNWGSSLFWFWNGPRCCISDKLSSSAVAAGLSTSVFESLLSFCISYTQSRGSNF